MMTLSRPRVVCLCGSTKFKDDFIELNKIRTLAGEIVLTVGTFGHADGEEHSKDQKAVLDTVHLAKIDLADIIIVVNTNGYVGESTTREIAYAQSQGKGMFFAYQYLAQFGNGRTFAWRPVYHVWNPISPVLGIPTDGVNEVPA